MLGLLSLLVTFGTFWCTWCPCIGVGWKHCILEFFMSFSMVTLFRQICLPLS